MNLLDAHYKYFLDPPLHASPVAVRVEIPGPGKFLLLPSTLRPDWFLHFPPACPIIDYLRLIG